MDVNCLGLNHRAADQCLISSSCFNIHCLRQRFWTITEYCCVIGRGISIHIQGERGHWSILWSQLYDWSYCALRKQTDECLPSGAQNKKEGIEHCTPAVTLGKRRLLCTKGKELSGEIQAPVSHQAALMATDLILVMRATMEQII